ncbi:MAG: DUF423 domain-containing protein [Flavobacteriales bacterium]|nr:DUF423 domain-containing protein [Flavobacteriales bacterium]
MYKRSLALGAGVLLVGVACGAFGAHALKVRLSPEALAQWKTAVDYQFYHGLGLVLLAALDSRVPTAAGNWVRRLFIGGVFLFCGSIYLLSTRELLGTYALSPILGPITPLGGLLFMAGWAVLLVTALRGTDVR